LEDQTFEVNYIENLTSEHEKLKNEFELEDFNLDESIDFTLDWTSNTIMSTPEPNLQTPSASPSLP